MLQVNGRNPNQIKSLAAFFANLAKKPNGAESYNAHVDLVGNLSLVPTGGNGKPRTVSLGAISNPSKDIEKGLKFQNVTLASLEEASQCLQSVAGRVGEKKPGVPQALNLTLGKHGLTIETTGKDGKAIKKTRVFGKLVTQKSKAAAVRTAAPLAPKKGAASRRPHHRASKKAK